MAYIEKTKQIELEKIEYVEKENKCPVCYSDRISICKGVEIYIEKNLKTNKILRRDKFGSTKFWHYKCRKCGWLSEICTE